VLEYLVPSTGKLYHHKMKMIRLKPESDTDEMVTYLMQRHALYLQGCKVNTKQLKGKNY
jgi:hypothetical protein